MKTLDEIIKIFETGMLISDKPINEAFREFNSDALHYLKEYRDNSSNYEKAYKRGYSRGYAKAKEDEEVSRRWEESLRASQMPWNHYTEMGG